MDMNMLYAKIDALKEQYYALLENICNIESNSADFAGVRAVNEAICAFARTRGFQVTIEAYDGAGACGLISMNDESDAPALLFSGHMDTVHKRGAFGNPPCRRDGDTLYGPGVADCKGGILVALLAMDALKQCGYTGRPLRLFTQCDEEVGSRYSGRRSINAMIAQAQRCAAFINCENARPGYITTRRKGILKIVLRVHGKAAHAKDYHEGASAVVEAAHKILRLHARSAPGGVTFNCTLPPHDLPTNTVPDICDIAIDMRVSSMEEAHAASQFVHQVADESFISQTHTEILKEGMRPPMEPTARNQELFDKINRICAACGLPTYQPFFSSGGADAANVSQAGVPTVDSMGIEGCDYHTLNERCRLSSMPERARVLCALAVHFDDGEGAG